MTLARIGRFLARHFVGVWCAIAFTPMVFASGLEGIEAEDTYKIGVLLLFFIVPVTILPLFALGEWLWRKRQWKRILVFLSSAIIPTGSLLAGAITGNSDTIFRGNVLLVCVIIYWLASNATDIGALAVASRLTHLRNKNMKGPNQASATSEPAPDAASSAPQG
jgi:small-conductance mechanosensitive channel